MRQVPYYLIIGSGYVARHIQHYFGLLNLPYTSWCRQQPSSLLVNHAQSASHILLLISDDAIIPFITKNQCLKSKTVIHFAASVSTTLATCTHPLMTFSESLYSLDQYIKIPFILETNHALTQLLPGLPNPSFSINPKDRALYHALCVIANNFSSLIWQTVYSDFDRRLNLPSKALNPLLQQTFTNIQNCPQQSLTGPLKRHDIKTIQHNLDALQSHPYLTIYKSFVETYSQAKRNDHDT